MEKQQAYHHSVTENGNLQLRIVTEYVKDGKVIGQQFSDPMTPADTKNMDGFDQRSKDIVAAIIDKTAVADFEVEKEEATGAGVEEIVKHDRVIEADGKIAVRRITRIFDDGKEVSKKFHRIWILPGDDPAGADVMSMAVAVKLHTEAVVADFKAAADARAEALEPAVSK